MEVVLNSKRKMTDEEFKRRSPIPEILRMLNPTRSSCGICGLPWTPYCTPKSVNYSKKRGTFATCEYCWERSSLEEVVTAHHETYQAQEAQLRRPNENMEVTWEEMKVFVTQEYNKTHCEHIKVKRKVRFGSMLTTCSKCGTLLSIIREEPIVIGDDVLENYTEEELEEMKKSFEYWCNVVLPPRKKKT